MKRGKQMRVVERNAVFVYPDLGKLNRQQSLKTNKMITSMYLIIDMANKWIEKILYSKAILRVNCLPTAKLKMVPTLDNSNLMIDNIRICIVNFQGIDYSDNYEKIINDYRNPASKISHLVALHILNDEDNNVVFEPDNSSRFDVIIKTNRTNLQNVLISIMLDIFLYHYFWLSTDIQERKEFNAKKIKYIIDCLSCDRLKEVYGNDFTNDHPDYLPFSLDCLKTEKFNLDKLNELLQSYSDFIINGLGKRVEINENGNVKNCKQYEGEYVNELQNILRENPADCTILVVRSLSTGKLTSYVLEYNKSTGHVDFDWISQLYACDSSEQSYRIFNVHLKEN